MIPVIVVLIYLAIVAYIGSVAFRKSKENTEDFFLAGRTIGDAHIRHVRSRIARKAGTRDRLEHQNRRTPIRHVIGGSLPIENIHRCWPPL